MRTDEEIHRQQAGIDHHCRGKYEVPTSVKGSREINRREQHPAALEHIIPMPRNEDVAARRPYVMRRSPNPIGLGNSPIAGTPDVARLVILPVSRHPKIVLRRLRNRRALLDRLRRLGQIVHLLLLLRRPKAGSPLIAVGHLVPISGHPNMVRRRIAPNAADPNVILARVVPSPIAGDPHDVCPVRLDVGRHLLDRLGRLLRHDERRHRIGDGRLGERLMHGAMREHLLTLLSGRALVSMAPRTRNEPQSGCQNGDSRKSPMFG